MSSLLCVIILVLSLCGFLLIFIPYLVKHTAELFQRMYPTVTELLRRFPGMDSRFVSSGYDLPKLLAASIAPLTTRIARGSAAVISAAGHAVYALIITYYILTIRRTISRYLLLLVPVDYRRVVLSSLLACKNAVLSYAVGILKTSAFVGGVTFLGLLILGIDDAFILSLFMGMLEVLPYVGPLLGAIPILIAAIPLGAGRTLLALMMLVLVQQLESGVIGPYFTASSTSIHPLAAILCVYLNGSLFGFAGVLFSIPLLVIARSIMWSLKSKAFQFDSQIPIETLG